MQLPSLRVTLVEELWLGGHYTGKIYTWMADLTIESLAVLPEAWADKLSAEIDLNSVDSSKTLSINAGTFKEGGPVQSAGSEKALPSAVSGRSDGAVAAAPDPALDLSRCRRSGHGPCPRAGAEV